MDKQQVEKLERRLVDRYRRDMDAIKRVKQLLAEEEMAVESANDEGSIEVAQGEEMPERAKSLISRVQMLFESLPTKPFTIASLEKLLKDSGWEFKASNPASSLHTAIRDLRERQIVKVFRQ
jgi:chromosome condensin MukBEF ATPase and DNA-binding subunit MukB